MWTTNSGSLAANFGRKCNNIKELKGWFSVASLSFGKGTLPLLSHGQDVKCYFEREKCQNALKAQNLGWFLQLHQAVDDLCLSQTGCQIQLLSGGHCLIFNFAWKVQILKSTLFSFKFCKNDDNCRHKLVKTGRVLLVETQHAVLGLNRKMCCCLSSERQSIQDNQNWKCSPFGRPRKTHYQRKEAKSAQISWFKTLKRKSFPH